VENSAPEQGRKPRLMYVVTSPLTVTLLRGQLRAMADVGFDVSVVSAPGPELQAVAAEEGVTALPVAMKREISPLADFSSLLALRKLMLERRPDIVNLSTPKAGLLGARAARMARVPATVYVLRGIRYETAKGLKRQLLRRAERIACGHADLVLCVSESVRKRLEIEGILSAPHSRVLGSGSSNGVDAARFAPTPERLERAAQMRREMGIADNAPVIGYVGRLTRDKGLPELLAAYEGIKRKIGAVRLLIVGGDETGDPLGPQVHKQLRSDRSVVCVGHVPDAAPYYHVMDVLALPTHREGFPNVVLEAYAAAKPVVATRATGVIDAVMEDGTGLLVPVGDAAALGEALVSLLLSPNTRHDMGDAGRRWVVRDFRPIRIWRELEREYKKLLHERGLPLPQGELPSTITMKVQT
jgi:glycosyltransferase involved in cell wall biosynthesis